jgi:predicted phosphodiesterase
MNSGISDYSGMKYCFTCIVCLCAAVLCASCTPLTPKTIEAPARFAIITNTAPESPYKPFAPELTKLIDAVNRENPSFVIHLGNIIYAGNTQGVRETDIDRQISERGEFFSKLDPVCFYVAGNLDFFKGSFSFFTKETKRPTNHSFHYGPVHFMAINSAMASISELQKKWIEDELEINKDDAAVIVLSYYPFMLQKNYAGYQPTVEDAESFHRIFIRYKVRAVISAAGEFYSRVDRDSIAYINAGAVPIYKKDGYDQFRYYIGEITKDSINVTGRKL